MAGWPCVGVVLALSLATPDALGAPPKPPAAAASPALAEAQKLREQGIKLAEEKNFSAAVPLLERALALREQALGANHLDVASVVSDLAEVALLRGDAAGATSLYLRAIAIVDKKLGAESLELPPLLTNLSLAERAERKLAPALQHAQRALAIREKGLGREHASVARSCRFLASLYNEAGDTAHALPLLERAVAIKEKTLGPEHLELTGDLGDLAHAYRRARDLGRAIPLMERIVAIYDKALGKDHPDTSMPLAELASMFDEQGSYARAIAAQERVLSLREKALGPDHKAVGDALNDLAAFHANAGNYGRATELTRRALALREKTLGKDHELVAITLNNLAELYLRRGDYRRAEPLYQRSLAIFEKTFGPEHEEVGVLLNNLASLHVLKGDIERARPLFLRALAIRERALGKDHPDLAGALGNVGEISLRAGDFAAAEPLFRRALAIREQALGKDHPLTAASVLNLGALYLEQGDGGRAEPLLLRGLAAQEKALGPEHPDLAGTLNNLAMLRQEAGDHAKAEALLSRAIAVQDRALGPDHPAVAISLHNLAALLEVEGKGPEALAAYARANEIGEHNLALIIPSGTEDQKLAYMSTLLSLTGSTVSLHLRERPGSAAAAKLALTTILRRKGRVLDAMAESMATLRKRLSPQDQALFDKLAAVRAELARAILGGLGATTAAERQREKGRLEDEARRLEAAISARSDAFRVQTEPVTVEKVQAALPEGAALVELFVFDPSDPRAPRKQRYAAPRYAAYVLHRSGKIAAADLGDAARLDAQVSAFREALRDPQRRDVKALGRALDDTLTRPIRAMLDGARSVLLATDGALNLIPFGALTDEQGRYLVERTSFTYLTSGRDLLRLAVHGERRQGATIIADPNFDRADGADGKQSSSRGGGEADGDEPLGGLAGARFPRLPGTAREAKAIAAILSGAAVLSDTRATKAAVARVHGPGILHVATHGFFLEDPPRKRAQDHAFASPFEAPGGSARAPNPLLQSGLAFAGANAKGGAQADGILTALEASGLDLSGTRLVVLSACQTGLGAVKNGNGVYGLRRALVIAGAETQVMSLWQIDDQATRDLMVAYYQDLQAGGGRGEALRQVQLSMLARPAVAHPYYWASFIVSGDPRTLDGKQVQPSFARVAPGPRGCGCEVGGQARGQGAAGALLLLAALAARRRRPGAFAIKGPRARRSPSILPYSPPCACPAPPSSCWPPPSSCWPPPSSCSPPPSSCWPPPSSCSPPLSSCWPPPCSCSPPPCGGGVRRPFSATVGPPEMLGPPATLRAAWSAPMRVFDEASL